MNLAVKRTGQLGEQGDLLRINNTSIGRKMSVSDHLRPDLDNTAVKRTTFILVEANLVANFEEPSAHYMAVFT